MYTKLDEYHLRYVLKWDLGVAMWFSLGFKGNDSGVGGVV